MIELRWVDWGISQEIEYRTLRPTLQASGAWGEPSQWSEWTRVPAVNAKDAYPPISDEPVSGRGARGDL